MKFKIGNKVKVKSVTINEEFIKYPTKNKEIEDVFNELLNSVGKIFEIKEIVGCFYKLDGIDRILWKDDALEPVKYCCCNNIIKPYTNKNNEDNMIKTNKSKEDDKMKSNKNITIEHSIIKYERYNNEIIAKEVSDSLIKKEGKSKCNTKIDKFDYKKGILISTARLLDFDKNIVDKIINILF